MGARKMQAFVNHISKNKITLVPIAIMLLGRILMHTTWPSTFAILSSVYAMSGKSMCHFPYTLLHCYPHFFNM
jgi:hypothetical protein